MVSLTNSKNSKKVVNGDGQRVAKPSKIHRCQWFSRKKTSYPIAPIALLRDKAMSCVMLDIVGDGVIKQSYTIIIEGSVSVNNQL